MHRGAARTRATSLLPPAIRGLFWLLNRSTGTLACVLCMGGLSLGHRQECLCHPRRYLSSCFQEDASVVSTKCLDSPAGRSADIMPANAAKMAALQCPANYWTLY